MTGSACLSGHFKRRSASWSTTNRALEESMRELHRLQETLAAKERRVVVAEAAQEATYEIERPLMSMSVFSEELLRLAEPDATIHPLAEKISERVEDMERILKGVREARKAAEDFSGAAEPPALGSIGVDRLKGPGNSRRRRESRGFRRALRPDSDQECASYRGRSLIMAAHSAASSFPSLP